MKCPYCGKELYDGVEKCPKCYAAVKVEKPKNNKVASEEAKE